VVVPIGMRIRRWARFTAVGLYRNGFFRTLFAEAGFVATVTGVVSFVLPDAGVRLAADILLLVVGGTVLLGCVIAAAHSWPGRKLIRTHSGSRRWSVEIVRADLFEQTVPIVVTTDREFNVSRAVVGSESLIAKLVERWFSGSEQSLVDASDSPLPQPHTIPGAVVEFACNGRRGFLLAVAEVHQHGPRTEWRDLIAGYDGLWGELRRRNLPIVAVPVIGSGYARAQLSHSAVLIQLIMSFHAASLQASVVRSLKIVIPADLDIPRGVRELFSSLGYR
jgi:Domain of unknown function (DUF6430)